MLQASNLFDKAWQLAEELYPRLPKDQPQLEQDIRDMQHAVAGVSIFRVLDQSEDCPPELSIADPCIKEDLAVAYGVRLALATERSIRTRGFVKLAEDHSSARSVPNV